ncbi:uncharacterized protein VTP21DRAFT_7872 [Calcarisporiella thermophila]|uniref:uncharacterized protein n=1 Tax=Calcarisporiella thermophila TaxID=911321 RepID=UPI0037446D72
MNQHSPNDLEDFPPYTGKHPSMHHQVLPLTQLQSPSQSRLLGSGMTKTQTSTWRRRFSREDLTPKNAVQFCVKGTGLSMMECVARILGHYKTDACGCRTLDRIGAVELAFRPEISVNDIIKKGFTLEDRQIPIYKVYNDHHNLLTVKLLDLPMQPEETLLEHIH